VTIRLGSALSRFSAPDALTNSVYRRARNYERRLREAMVEGLESDFEWNVDQNCNPFLAKINGEGCISGAKLNGTEPWQAVAQAISVTIYQNRDLYVVGTLADALRDLWGVAGESADNFHARVTERADRGFRISRETMEERIPGDPLGDPSVSLSVILSGSFSDAEKSELASLCEAIQEEGYYDRGVLIPRVQIEQTPHLDDHEFFIQRNDLPLPVMNSSSSGRTPAAVIADRLRFEVMDNPGAFVTRESTLLLLDLLRKGFPALVDQAARKDALVSALPWLLREVVDAKLSIRDLREILERLLPLRDFVPVDPSGEPIVLSPVSEFLTLFTRTAGKFDLQEISQQLKDAIAAKARRGEASDPVTNRL
jgi:hypothetical protein